VTEVAELVETTAGFLYASVVETTTAPLAIAEREVLYVFVGAVTPDTDIDRPLAAAAVVTFIAVLVDAMPPFPPAFAVTVAPATWSAMTGSGKKDATTVPVESVTPLAVSVARPEAS